MVTATYMILLHIVRLKFYDTNNANTGSVIHSYGCANLVVQAKNLIKNPSAFGSVFIGLDGVQNAAELFNGKTFVVRVKGY